MSISSDELHLTPPDVLQEAQDTTDSLLPEKSKDRYLNTYENFLQWKQNKNATSYSENVLMAYFNDLATNYKPSTLWSIYSMLKCTIKTKNNLDITKYSKLTAFLKRRNSGFKPKKSKVLSAADIKKFINEAPDCKYLATKVALIFGITGACRREELSNITTENITTLTDIIVVKIPNTKTKISRTFVIEGEFHTIVKKYQALRTNKSKTNRFFQNYQNGKCINQCIGINKFGAMPKQIATFLGLPDPELYTGHSFRRTSATLLVDSGADLTTLKRHGGWKSNSVAESYIEDSLENKINIGGKISKAINLHRPSTSKEPDFQPSTSAQEFHIPLSTMNSMEIESPTFTENEPERENLSQIQNTNMSQSVKFAGKTMSFNLHNCNNVTFNFNK